MKPAIRRFLFEMEKEKNTLLLSRIFLNTGMEGMIAGYIQCKSNDVIDLPLQKEIIPSAW